MRSSCLQVGWCTAQTNKEGIPIIGLDESVHDDGAEVLMKSLNSPGSAKLCRVQIEKDMDMKFSVFISFALTCTFSWVIAKLTLLFMTISLPGAQQVLWKREFTKAAIQSHSQSSSLICFPVTSCLLRTHCFSAEATQILLFCSNLWKLPVKSRIAVVLTQSRNLG